jgi:type II secretory pathway component PulF
VPLTEALETLARQHHRGSRIVLEQLRDRVSAGAALASAMAEHSRLFDSMCLQVTRVGEDAGTLEASLARLATHLERSRRMRGKLATAMIYPGLVLGTAVIVTFFLMTFVVPSIIEPLQEMGRPLPLTTRFVKGVSDFTLAWGWVLGLLALAGGLGLLLAVRTSRGRRAWHAFLLRLPLVGELIRKQAIVQVAVTMSTLMKSGIVFVAALQSARGATRNVILAEALERCEQAVTAGNDVGPALEKSRAFGPVVVQVFSVGQQSGRLEEMLDRLAEDYDEEVSAAAQRLTAVLEPAMILVLALIVLTIAMATMLPILEAGNALE